MCGPPWASGTDKVPQRAAPKVDCKASLVAGTRSVAKVSKGVRFLFYHLFPVLLSSQSPMLPPLCKHARSPMEADVKHRQTKEKKRLNVKDSVPCLWSGQTSWASKRGTAVIFFPLHCPACHLEGSNMENHQTGGRDRGEIQEK